MGAADSEKIEAMLEKIRSHIPPGFDLEKWQAGQASEAPATHKAVDHSKAFSEKTWFDRPMTAAHGREERETERE
jgi:hypothetical protein